MSEIIFFNFKIELGFFSCFFKDDKDSKELEFTLNHKISLNNNLIAHALSTLCARGNYKKIHFDLPISNETLLQIEEFCHADVTCFSTEYKNLNFKGRNSISLNFSGGFDSLAAKILMPFNIRLVSMDFGGKFSREQSFFSKFNPYTVTTNLLSTHLSKNSWSFMGIASILYSEHLNIKYSTFGGILEAGPANFKKNPTTASLTTFNPFLNSGMLNAPYVIGLTEIATSMIVGQVIPEHINASLDSLANSGESKKFRKQIIVDTVFHKFGFGCKIEKFDKPNNKLRFGESFSSDFLSFYLIKHRGIELINNIYYEVPDTIVELSQKLDLSFYEKVNTNFLEKFPKELLPEYSKKLIELNILSYTQNDWFEFELISNELSKFYKI